MRDSYSDRAESGGDGCFDISVVMACYTEDRLPNIESALSSLRKQALQPGSVIVAVDNNESLARELRDRFDWIIVVLNRGAPGASATRNRGVAVVETT
jgi:glycosyltransferase involved in cell wall biosynthesis